MLGAQGKFYPVKPCRRCGNPFDPVSGNHRYCSDECKRGSAECGGCGRTFVPTKKSKGLFCSTECFYEALVPTGSRKPHGGGYFLIKVPKGTPGALGSNCTRRWMLEHRYVMQQHLGRPLRTSEHVHHLNGDRADNRIENLELWKRRHPFGVRDGDYHCPGCRCMEATDGPTHGRAARGGAREAARHVGEGAQEG